MDKLAMEREHFHKEVELMGITPKPVYTKQEVSKILNLSLNTITRYINDGLLTKVAGSTRRVLISASSLMEFINGK